MTEAYTEIGDMLRRARQARPMSIEQASTTLHIRVRYLQALEEGRLDDLPGRTYVKGYLFAYAELLQMDKEELLRQFDKVELSQRRGFHFSEVLSSEKEASPRMIWMGLAAALFAYGIWALLVHEPGGDIGDIEAWKQQLDKKGHISASALQKVACLEPQDVLYPPCYAEEPEFYMLPLNRRMVSVMDLMK